jgi:hypothetical protein
MKSSKVKLDIKIIELGEILNFTMGPRNLFQRYFVREELEKVYVTPQLFRVDYFTSQTIKPDFLPLELSKTGQITPPSGFEWWFC